MLCARSWYLACALPFVPFFFYSPGILSACTALGTIANVNTQQKKEEEKKILATRNLEGILSRWCCPLLARSQTHTHTILRLRSQHKIQWNTFFHPTRCVRVHYLVLLVYIGRRESKSMLRCTVYLLCGSAGKNFLQYFEPFWPVFNLLPIVCHFHYYSAGWVTSITHKRTKKGHPIFTSYIFMIFSVEVGSQVGKL